MSSFKAYTLTESDITQQCNIAKECLIKGLVSDGVIDKEVGQTILTSYVIVVCRKGWFGRTMDKLRGITDDSLYYKCLRETYYTDLDKEEPVKDDTKELEDTGNAEEQDDSSDDS